MKRLSPFDRVRAINPARLAVAGVLLLAVTVGLFFWMRDVVREVIVLPVSYIIFVGGILVDSAPQVFFWVGAIIIGFWIAFRSIDRRPRLELLRRPSSTPDVFFGVGGRVAFWTTRVQMMREHRSGYYQGGFHHALGRLLIDLLAHRYRLTRPEIEERVRAGSLPLPDDVREYALFHLSRPDFERRAGWHFFWSQISDKIRAWLGLPSAAEAANTPAALARRRVSTVIQYMEQELDIKHG